MNAPLATSPHAFLHRAGARRPWVVGGMAYGIASTALVNAAARAGCLAFYGAAGLPLDRVDADLARLDRAAPVGLNLAHHPHPTRDGDLVRLALTHGVERVEASAFLRPTPALLGFRWSGRADGPPRLLLVKLSRLAAAERWLAPPHRRTLRRAVAEGWLTEDEAARAAEHPACDALVLEGDSGGHTDRRSWLTLLPAVQALRGDRPVHLGVAGGLGTPEAVAAALAAGADFAAGGSIHQSCDESGVRDDVRAWLRAADCEDFAYAPSPVHFGTPARVQVLGRPSPFAAHARRLERIWQEHGDAPLTGEARAFVEACVGDLDAAWEATAAWLAVHDPALLADATTPRARLALLCRAWLARCARRAVDDDGEPDVQVWSGPAVAACNRRAAGTPLAHARPVAALCRWMAPLEVS